MIVANIQFTFIWQINFHALGVWLLSMGNLQNFPNNCEKNNKTMQQQQQIQSACPHILIGELNSFALMVIIDKGLPL